MVYSTTAKKNWELEKKDVNETVRCWEVNTSRTDDDERKVLDGAIIMDEISPDVDQRNL